MNSILPTFLPSTLMRSVSEDESMKYNYKGEGAGKHIFLGVTALVCFLLASSVFPFLSSPDTAKPLPDIMLCFVCALPAFTDIKKASIYALALGFLADLFVNLPTAFSPVVFLCCMMLAYACQKYFSRVGTLVIAISTIPCSIVRKAVRFAVASFTVGGAAAKKELFMGFPMWLVVDFALAIALSFIMRVICKKMRFIINN